MADPAEPTEPFLRVVRGDASAGEVAALVAALAAVAAARSRAAAGAERGPVRNEWDNRARLMRSPVRPAAGGWRRSALP